MFFEMALLRLALLNFSDGASESNQKRYFSL